jgi:molecular chaperone DnaK
VFPITGSDFVDGVIPAGAELVCDYEVLDSGNIFLDVSVPAIGGNFRSGRNFYSRKEAELDYTNIAQRVREGAEHASVQLTDLAQRAEHPALEQARDKLAKAKALSPNETNPETAKQAMDNVQRAKELLAQARQQNLPVMRALELERVVTYFEDVRKLAKGSEEAAFDALAKTAERSTRLNGAYEAAQQANTTVSHVAHERSWTGTAVSASGQRLAKARLEVALKLFDERAAACARCRDHQDDAPAVCLNMLESRKVQVRPK